MSGGVDSSVAAARMVDAGHDVVGVHLALSSAPGTLRTGSRGCCSKEDASDARRVADVLGIPFYVWDFAERFQTDVVDDFVSSYARGETPNPCVRCNQRIKFSALSAKALALGFDTVATGHYARLSAGQLRHASFPIGDTAKPRIRAEAARRGLAVADKPDSHDICFIPSGNTRAFLGERIGVRRGTVVGPRYVAAIDAEAGTVRVGEAADLEVRALIGRSSVFTAGVAPKGPVECAVQVRAHGETASAVAELVDDELLVRLHAPLRGVARGQTLVLYRPDPVGDEVLGSATIAGTSR